MITPALAQTAAAGEGNFLLSLMPLIIIFLIFYLLIIRPQQKKMKQHRDMVSAVVKGDKVLTSGGIIGTVKKVVDEHEAIIEIADNVEVRVMKTTLSDVIAKKGEAKKQAPKSVTAKK